MDTLLCYCVTSMTYVKWLDRAVSLTETGWTDEVREKNSSCAFVWDIHIMKSSVSLSG